MSSDHQLPLSEEECIALAEDAILSTIEPDNHAKAVRSMITDYQYTNGDISTGIAKAYLDGVIAITYADTGLVTLEANDEQ